MSCYIMCNSAPLAMPFPMVSFLGQNHFVVKKHTSHPYTFYFMITPPFKMDETLSMLLLMYFIKIS